MSLESPIGAGTSLHVELPLDDATAESRPGASAQPAPVAFVSRLASPRDARHQLTCDSSRQVSTRREPPPPTAPERERETAAGRRTVTRVWSRSERFLGWISALPNFVSPAVAQARLQPRRSVALERPQRPDHVVGLDPIRSAQNPQADGTGNEARRSTCLPKRSDAAVGTRRLRLLLQFAFPLQS